MVGNRTLPRSLRSSRQAGRKEQASPSTLAVWLRPTLHQRAQHTLRAAGRGRAAVAGRARARARHSQGPRKRQAGPMGLSAAHTPRLRTPPGELDAFRARLIALTSAAGLAGLPQARRC